MRVGQTAHRRMRRGGPEQQVRKEVERVDRAAGDIAALEILERVDLVGDQEQAPGSPPAGGTSRARAGCRQEAHGHADQQEVRDRVGEADGEPHRVEIARDHLGWMRNVHDRIGDAGRQDGRIEHATAVTAADATPDQQERPSAMNG